MRQTFYTLLLATTLLTSACALDTPYSRPDVETPASWRGDAQTSSVIDPNWWQNFNSIDLNNYIQQANQQNTDIAVALARIDQARAQGKISSAPLFPSVNATGTASTNDTNRTSSSKSFGGGINVAYELDVWGRNRNTAKAARKNITASQFDKDAVALVVTSDTAQAYFNILALQQRIRNAEDNLKLSRDVTKIIQARFTEGAASGQDVAQQNTAIANVEASLSSLHQQLTNNINQLNIVLGQPPQTPLPALDKTDQAVWDQLTVPNVAPLQPAALLERRPDIRSLEQSLEAAHINIAVARANFFPSVSLGLNTSANTPALSSPVTWGTGLVGSVTAPIFNGGQLQGQLELNTAREKELAAQYRGAVLVAFREAEDALAAVKAASERQVSLSTARDESRRYYNIARERYISGADDFLTLLDAQRTLIQAEDSYIQAQLERLTASLALFKAMGGGWNGGDS